MDQNKKVIGAPSHISCKAMRGHQWEFEYITNLLFGANPRSVYVEYEPGNATCYTLLIVPTKIICTVGGKQFFGEREVLVTWVGHSKSYVFSLGNIHEDYLAEKLGIENRADLSQIAFFLNCIAK